MARHPFLKELAKAALLNLLCLAWIYRAPLTQGKVIAMHGNPPSADALVGMGEMVYELQPALAVQARQIRAGQFPFWSPGSQGGTPLIGKLSSARAVWMP